MPSTTATTPSSIRTRRAAAGIVLLCTSSVACAMTTMTASSARVPVLIGPVACLDCSAASAAALPRGAPLSDRAHISGGHMWLPYLGDTGFFGASPTQIDLKAESMVPDPCKGEIRVSALRVESFAVEAFLFVRAEQTVDLSGEVLAVPNGACGPRLWPYSGLRGIVYFDPAGAAAGARRETPVAIAVGVDRLRHRLRWRACRDLGQAVPIRNLVVARRPRQQRAPLRPSLLGIRRSALHRCTRMGFFYSAFTPLSTFDISEDVNAQVAAVGGEAVVGLTVSASDACDVLNYFPLLNILPLWPGCVPVTVTGDIVRRKAGGGL